MKILITIVGVILLVIGFVTVFLPLPIGMVCILVGAAMLAGVNEPFRRSIKWLRRKVKPVDKALDEAEKVLPEPLAKPLHETDPDEDDEDDADDAVVAIDEEVSSKDGTAKARVRVRANEAPPTLRRRPAYPRSLIASRPPRRS